MSCFAVDLKGLKRQKVECVFCGLGHGREASSGGRGARHHTGRGAAQVHGRRIYSVSITRLLCSRRRPGHGRRAGGGGRAARHGAGRGHAAHLPAGSHPAPGARAPCLPLLPAARQRYALKHVEGRLSSYTSFNSISICAGEEHPAPDACTTRLALLSAAPQRLRASSLSLSMRKAA